MIRIEPAGRRARALASIVAVAVALLLLFAAGALAQATAADANDAALRQITILESMAATAAAEQRYPAAIDNHSRALELAAPLQRPRLTAVLLSRLGQTYEQANRIQSALVASELALKALQSADPVDLGRVIERISVGGKGFGGNPEPISPDLYRASVARDLQTEADDPALVVRVLINIGNGYLRQPQEGPALRAYELALERPQIAGQPLLQAHALANSGEILRRQRRFDAAQDRLTEAIRLIERHGQRVDTRRALASLARLQAEQYRTDEAIASYGRASALYRQADDRRGEARAELGRGLLELERQNAARAAASYRRAVEVGRTLNDLDLLWQGLWGLGRSQQQRGELDAAAASFGESLRYIADREGDLATDEGKVALLRQAGDAFDQLVLINLQRAQRNPAAYVDALRYAEEGRARALSRLMQGWSGMSRPSPASVNLQACYRPPVAANAPAGCANPRWDASIANQVARGTAATADDCDRSRTPLPIAMPELPQMASGTLAGQPMPLPQFAPQHSAGAEETGPDPSQMAIGIPGRPAPALGHLPSPSAPTVPAQMAIATPLPLPFDVGAAPPRPPGAPPPPMLPRLDAPLAALSRLVFHSLDDRTAVFAVARDGRVSGHVAPIGAAQLQRRIAALRDALDVDRAPRSIAQADRGGEAAGPAGAARASATDPQPALRALYADLIAPLAGALPPAGELLVIEPHGPLWLLPFAALQRADGSWFGDRHPLVHAPSLATLNELRRAAAIAPKRPPSLLALGNPVEATRPTGADDPFRGSFTPLPGAADEVRKLRALFADDAALLLIGAQGKLATIEKEAGNYSILHFATHGLADPRRPLESFLLLAESECDDRLTARRIMTLPLTADLVTLSACQTGLGDISGEGVIGLSRAFFVAGAKSVLVSLWSVSDEATEQLMSAFYRFHIRDRLPREQALARAMQMLRSGSGFESPRYWAPFMLIGAAS